VTARRPERSPDWYVRRAAEIMVVRIEQDLMPDHLPGAFEWNRRGWHDDGGRMYRLTNREVIRAWTLVYQRRSEGHYPFGPPQRSNTASDLPTT
jgi:hypothetical protein